MTSVNQCVVCGQTESEMPLVAMRYRGVQVWVCTACIPVVIHHAHQIMGRLQQAAEAAEVLAESNEG